MTTPPYRCVHSPKHGKIVLLAPDFTIVHRYDDRYPAHLGTCRRFARMKNETATRHHD